MEPENGSATPIQVQDAQPEAESLALTTLDSQRIVTTLPLDIVRKISCEVGQVKLNRQDAQEIVDSFQAVLGPGSDVDTGDPIPAVEDILEQVRSIAVTDSSQKHEMQEAHRLRMLLRARRVQVDNLRKDKKEDAKHRSDFVDGCGRGIRLILEEAEAYAKYQEDFKAREVAEKREAKYRERKALLAPFLSIAHGDLEPVGLIDVSDEAFTEYLDNAKSRHYDRIARSRFDELAKWNYAGEVEVLGILSDEGFADLLANTKIAFQIEQEKEQQKQQKRIDRIKQLSEIGLRYAANANAFIYDEMSVSDVDITAFDDIAFAETVTRCAAKIKEREAERVKREAMEKATEDRRISRIQRLSALGMSFNGSQYVYEDLNFSQFNIDCEDDAAFEGDYAIIAPEIARRKQAKANADAAADAIRVENERKAKEQADAAARAEADAKRLRLAPDKDKLLAFAFRLHFDQLDVPAMSTVEGSHILARFKDKLTAAAEQLESEAEALTETADCPF